MDKLRDLVKLMSKPNYIKIMRALKSGYDQSARDIMMKTRVTVPTIDRYLEHMHKLKLIRYNKSESGGRVYNLRPDKLKKINRLVSEINDLL